MATASKYPRYVAPGPKGRGKHVRNERSSRVVA